VYAQSDRLNSTAQARGILWLFAGRVGDSGNVDGTGTAARFDASGCVAIDSTGNCTIRKIIAAGVLSSPTGIRLFGNSLDFGSNNGELLITNLPSPDLAKLPAARNDELIKMAQISISIKSSLN
jgi:hypothetical protein